MSFVAPCVLLYFFASLAIGRAGVFIFLFYLAYLHQIHDHLPGPPRSSFILGRAPAILRYRQSGRTLFHYLLDNRLSYGSIYVIFFVHKPFVVIVDPAEVRKICIDMKDHVYNNRDNSGYRIPKGDMAICESYVFSFNPDIWPNPSVFDPERFDAPEKIPNFAGLYFPFSLDPQNRIGQVFAKFEFLVILAQVLRQFQFTLLPGQTNAMEERAVITPRDGVMCKVIKR